MTKQESLNNVRLAAMALAMAGPVYTGHQMKRFRKANAALALALLDAAAAGAQPWEILAASEWNGVPQ